MSTLQDTLQSQPTLNGACRLALDQAQRRQEPMLFSWILPTTAHDPLDVFRHSRALAEDRLLWSQSEGLAMVGIGSLHTIQAMGPARFPQVRRDWRALSERAVVHGDTGIPGTGAVLLGGFAFDAQARTVDDGAHPETGVADPSTTWAGFPDALLVLPGLLFTRQGDQAWLTVNTFVHPTSDPVNLTGDLQATLQAWTTSMDRVPNGSANHTAHPHEELQGGSPQPLQVEDVQSKTWWMETVTSLAREMRQQPVDKVVLARQVRVKAAQPLEPELVLRRLQAASAHGYQFAVARGQTCFLGMTPERLVKLADGNLQATCLAGSAARGATELQDRELAQALLGNGKDRREHQVVVEAIRTALQPICSELHIPAEPGLCTTGSVQHLHTPVNGRLNGKHCVLELIERLHPTPAVGGYPRQAALDLIRRKEGVDRGWYAAPVGWCDAAGDGEFAVAIRSALLSGNQALLYAGCGIMPDSDPEQEYEESCLKLQSLLAALTESNP